MSDAATETDTETNLEPTNVDEGTSTETVETPSAASGDAAPADVGKWWKVAEESLGNVEVEKLPDYVAELTPQHFAELPTAAKQFLRDAWQVMQRTKDEAAKVGADREKAISEREARLEKARADLARNEAAFAALSQDPEIQKILATPKENLPDPMTPEGMEARIQRAVAERVAAIFEPVGKAAAQKSQEAAYLAFVEEHPEMREDTFRAEVEKEVLAHKVGDAFTLKTPQAYEIVKARRVLAERERRRTQEATARRESARHMGRSTSSGGPVVEIPPELRKPGNIAKLYEFLEANPQAARAVRERRI